MPLYRVEHRLPHQTSVLERMLTTRGIEFERIDLPDDTVLYNIPQGVMSGDRFGPVTIGQEIILPEEEI